MKKLILILILLSAIIFLNAQTAGERIAYVRELFEERQFDEAFVRANQIITEFPGSTESFDARMVLADIQYERGLYSEARMQLMLLLTNPFQMTFQQRARTYFKLGNVFYREREYQQAIESFERLYLDYQDTREAQRSVDAFFDSYFMMGDYQSVIIKSREMQRKWTGDEIQAELLYQQAKAYITGNMKTQATETIASIRSRYPQSSAAGRAIELQILLIDREQGRQAAIDRLVGVLNETLQREAEESLMWLLVRYYLDDSSNTAQQVTTNSRLALQRLDALLSKYNLSENLSKYYVVWLRLMTETGNLRPIFEKEDFILRVSRNRAEYPTVVYYLAKAHSQAQNWWAARGYLDDTIGLARTDSLRFDYNFLYAGIYTSQGQYTNSIEIYNSLLSNFASLGRNYDVYMKLGDINLLHLNQPAQALNFYRQAVSLAKNTEQTSAALFLSAQCLEATGQYSEALYTLSQIPLEKIENRTEREKIANKITLLHTFYNADISAGISSILMMNMLSSQQHLTAQIAILALQMKRFNDALEMLKTQSTPEAAMERVKLYFLFAYKSLLEGNQTEKERYLALARTETQALGRNINPTDQAMIDSFGNLLANNGKFNNRNISTVKTYLETTSNNDIDLRNLFAFKLWSYYHENNLTDEMLAIAPTIIPDPFVSNLDFQRVNVILASQYYKKENYTAAITHFQKAERYLTLAYPEYYYEYAMSLYHTQNTDPAMTILQRLVLNNVDNSSLIEARNMIIEHWLEQNRLPDALDILNQIPSSRRTDADYRYLVTVYLKLDEKQQEKDALLYIREKTMAEDFRLGWLHFLTGDKVMAEWTFNDIISRSSAPVDRLNAYAYLGHIAYLSEEWANAIAKYEEFFKILTPPSSGRGAAAAPSIDTSTLLIPPSTVAKELIIACYRSGNRPKAETLQRTHSTHISRNTEIMAEIKLYEAIYYVRIEPRRAIRSLTQLIEERGTPLEIAFRALYHRGIAHIQDKKPENAEADFILALTTTNESLKNEIRLSLGTYYLLLEDHENALEYYYQAIVNDHDGKFAKDAAHNFAVTCRQIGDWQKAISAYKIILDRWGQSHLERETLLTIAFCFVQARQYDEALNILNHILDQFTTNELKAETQYWIAECYVGKGDFLQSDNAFQNIRLRYPREDRWVRLAQFRIAETTHNQRQDPDRAKMLFNDIIRQYGANSDVGKEAAKYIGE